MLGRVVNMGRNIKICGAALAACLVLTACGGSGGGGGGAVPSALDPANMVPATSVVYLSGTVRPQGDMRSNLVEAIDSIAGRGTADTLARKIESSRSLRWNQLKSWFGQRVGVAITGLPAQFAGTASIDPYVLVVAPTSDPAAAKSWLTKHKPGNGETWKVVGHYVLVGGANAVGQAVATSPKTSLADSAQYKADMAQLGSGELFTLYAPLHQLLTAITPLLQSNPQFPASSLADAEKQAPPGSSAALGLAALHNEFRLDVISEGMPKRSVHSGVVPTDVGSLPADSWLALSLGGGLTDASTLNKLTASLRTQLARIQALSGAGSAIPSAPLRFVEQDLLPALGPIALSVSGTSSSTLKAGLVMSPLNPSAGPRLASAVKQLVNGLPISASATGGHVAVTFGYTSLEQLLAPLSKLADNGTFKTAMGQLPAGAKANVYLDFGPISALASLSSSTSSPSVMRVLHRLDYLIGGGTHSHFRLVLTTH